jgi:hypothetical protein
MCGIYAVIGRTKHGLNSSDGDVLQQMMFATIPRGDDSTGLFMTDYLHPTKAPTGVKVLGGPHNIVYNAPLWKDVLGFLQRKAGAVIGHGRSATRGNISATNAHPFQHDHITLVHNGTLHGGVSYQKKGDVSIDVDSHALAVAMAEKGVARALSEVKGAYAVIVHDAKEGKLYVARNNDRPLCIYSSASRHYIMSEGDYLKTIVDRENKIMPKDTTLLVFKPETLVEFDLSDPEFYRPVGDIKALREAHEASETTQRVKEDEERRKKYQQGSPPSGSSASGSSRLAVTEKERHVLRKGVTEVSFLVEGFDPFGVNYRFYGRTPIGTKVFFISDTPKPEYIQRIGRAPVHSHVYKGDRESVFVKHRLIEWAKVLEDQPTGEEPAKAGFFLTANNKRISVDDWEKLRTHGGCNTCDATFGMLDYRKVVLTDDNMLLCIACAAEFSVGQVPKAH